MIHDDDNNLFPCSYDLINTVCFSIAKLFLCDLQEFSKTNDERPTITESKWRRKKKSTNPKLPKRGDILWGIITPKELKSNR